MAMKAEMSRKSLNMTASRIPPTMHRRVRCANAPTIKPAIRLTATAACFAPGAFAAVEKWINAGAASSNTNKAISTAGRINPSRRGSLYVRFNVYPLFRKNTPAPMPKTKPTRPKSAFQSPPAMRKIMRNGQPRNIRQPIMTKKPSMKRVSGELPPLALNSLLPIATTKLPSTNPIISGRIYCTGAAE